MRFAYEVDGSVASITAIFEDGDRRSGPRQEGPGTELTLRIDTATFDYAPSSVHPDLLGVACMVTFYPFIGGSVEFPEPVSPRLAEAFARPIFAKDREISFRNVDPDVPMFEGSRLALALGGGVDSSSARVLFPEAFVVHEAHIRDGERIPSRTAHLMESLQADGNGRLMWSNQRYLSDPGGWHGWPAPAIPALLMAQDLDLGAVMVGSNLGSQWLLNGRKYFDRFAARKWHGESGNYWAQVFWDVGIPLFSPVGGMSEMLTYRIAHKGVAPTEIEWCTLSDERSCGKCTKCFRRDVIGRSLGLADPDWDGYRNDAVMELLQTRPLYFGHIFATAMTIRKRWPRWIKKELRDLPKLDWTLRHNPDMTEFFPERWRDLVAARVASHSEPMTHLDRLAIRAWDQT